MSGGVEVSRAMSVPGPIQPIEILALREGQASVRADTVAVEAPLQIRVRAAGGERERDVSITMRTPGGGAEDLDLAIGFLFTEGILRGAGDLIGAAQPGPDLVVITLRDGARLDWRGLDRGSVTTSACGVCGKSSIDSLAAAPGEPLHDGPFLAPGLICDLPRRLRAAQPTFELTGGLHAAALFDAAGALIDLREDVGRHNAVDKLLGARLRAGGLPAHGQVLVVSGRASFELVQKARMAAIPIFVAVGAPSSLAVGLATEAGMTLCGFTRPERCNIYSAPQRLGLEIGPDNVLAKKTKDWQGVETPAQRRQEEEKWSAQAQGPRRGRSLRTIPSE